MIDWLIDRSVRQSGHGHSQELVVHEVYGFCILPKNQSQCVSTPLFQPRTCKILNNLKEARRRLTWSALVQTFLSPPITEDNRIRNYSVLIFSSVTVQKHACMHYNLKFTYRLFRLNSTMYHNRSPGRVRKIRFVGGRIWIMHNYSWIRPN